MDTNDMITSANMVVSRNESAWSKGLGGLFVIATILLALNVLPITVLIWKAAVR